MQIRSFLFIPWDYIRRIQKYLASERILAIGDSHVKIFSHWKMMLSFPDIYFSIVSVLGATASGLDNPNSKTQAYNIFEEAFRSEKFKKVIVLLGEVDTGFVIWHRSQKYKVAVSEILAQTIDKYTSFLSDYSGKVDKLIVISAPLPTIKDGVVWSRVANLRKEVTATQKERTELTLEFNKTVEQYCDKNRIVFINLDEESLGDNGLIINSLYNKNPRNHHYNRHQYALLLVKKMKEVL